MLTLGEGLDAIEGEFGGKEGFELEFKDFALELLGTLFGAAFEVLDLFLHGGEGLVFFCEFQAEAFFGVFLGFVAGDGEGGLDAGFDGEIHFAFGIVEFALFGAGAGPGPSGLRRV